MAEGARDRGLQAERTALAWSRTALAVVANALILLRAGVVEGRSELAALGGLLMVAAALTQCFSLWRRRTLLRAGPASAAPAAGIAAMALVTAVCSGAASIALLWSLNAA